MSAQDPDLGEAARSLRRLLLAATALVVAGQTAWTLLAGAERAWASLAVAALSTTALLTSVWVVVGLMVRSGPGLMTAWLGGGYMLRIALLVATVLGARAAALDARLIGVGLLVAILVATLGEVVVFSRARVLTPRPGPPREPGAGPEA